MGIRKATAERFNKAAYALVVKLGGKPAQHYDEERLELQTPAGTLFVWPVSMPWRGKPAGHYTVFCRFADPEQALELYGAKLNASFPRLNPYTGKFNFHATGHDADCDRAVVDFRRHLEEVLT